MKAWYVINTKPRQENVAKNYLCAKGIEIFNPQLPMVSKKTVKQTFKSFFPGYIFGNFNLNNDYSLVKWGIGVKNIVGFGGSPSPICHECIEMLKNSSNEHGVINKITHLKTDDKIRISSGTLKDFQGIFKDWISENERVKVLLDFVGYQHTVELHYSLLEKVD